MTVGFEGLRVLLVGPVPPPHGGMANQTLQLADLLRGDGASVNLVAVNAPYRPAWIGRIRAVRAVFRLVPYLRRAWHAAGRADVLHIMASSGWAWHLYAAPAVWIGWARKVPTVVNYRGGGAGEFFHSAMTWARPTLARSSSIIVPSPFLERVFRTHGFRAGIVPNIIDLERFASVPAASSPETVEGAPHVVVARNLEPIYDVETALRAFHLVRKRLPGATMSVAGSGASRASLVNLARELGIQDSVVFTGRLDNREMADLYRRADLALNPSLADNMPISILEALASGVPVVSTNVGGIPDLIGDSAAAVLVAPRDPEGMAAAVLELMMDPDRRRRQIEAGIRHVEQFTWERVRPGLLSVYAEAIERGMAGRRS